MTTPDPAPTLPQTLPQTLYQTLQQSIARHPQGMAFDFQGQTYSWQSVSDMVAALGQCLTQLGIAPTERVGFIAHTRPHHVACLWGLLIHGRVASMIYGYQAPAKLAADIRELRYPLVIADAGDWTDATVAAARACGSAGLSISAAGIEWVPGLEAVGAGAERRTLPGIAVETLSSGTTGKPKRIALALANLQASAEAAVVSIRNMQGSDAAAPLIVALPLGNISGVYAVTPPALMGSPIALMEKFATDQWLEFVQRYQPVTADVPPAALAMLYQQGIDRQTLASVRVVRTGAAPLDRKVHDYFADTLGIPVNLSYGASEFCGVVTTWMLDDLERYGSSKRGSCGRPLPGIELRIVDRDSGALLAPDQIGLLEVRAQRVGPDWIRTADLARLDSEGFMWFAGRADDTIFRGGFKLAPDSIAEVLRRHPAIADAGVVGVPDPRLGEVPVAALVLKPGAARPDTTALKDFAREHLSAQQIPVTVVWLPQLPRTASLKLQTVELKRQVLQALATQLAP